MSTPGVIASKPTTVDILRVWVYACKRKEMPRRCSNTPGLAGTYEEVPTCRA